MDLEDEELEGARKRLWPNNTFRLGEETLVVACLIRPEDARPLHAPWWRGKQAYLIGVEENGSFFLRHCDGSVRYWDHATQKDKVIAKSVREFVTALQPTDRRL